MIFKNCPFSVRGVVAKGEFSLFLFWGLEWAGGVGDQETSQDILVARLSLVFIFGNVSSSSLYYVWSTCLRKVAF